MSAILEKTREAIDPLFNDSQFELVDLTYQKVAGAWTLTFVIDKPGGVNLGECDDWRKKISDILDQKDFISNSYTLEISSPGIFRALKKTKDFQRYVGERVRVRTFGPVEGRKNFLGVLQSANESQLTLEVDGKEYTVSRDQVSKANLEPELKF